MERDVLIEYAAEGVAVISLRIPVETAMENPDYKFLVTMHAELSDAKYEDLDFMEMINKMKPVIEKYEKLPLMPEFTK